MMVWPIGHRRTSDRFLTKYRFFGKLLFLATGSRGRSRKRSQYGLGIPCPEASPRPEALRNPNRSGRDSGPTL